MKNNLARGLIGAVFLVNLQSALAFLLRPGAYAPAFELGGVAGAAMVRGLGVLFLMWNVPYAVALWHPARHRNFVFAALAMQAIGLVGRPGSTLRCWPLPRYCVPRSCASSSSMGWDCWRWRLLPGSCGNPDPSIYRSVFHHK